MHGAWFHWRITHAVPVTNASVLVKTPGNNTKRRNIQLYVTRDPKVMSSNTNSNIIGCELHAKFNAWPIKDGGLI